MASSFPCFLLCLIFLIISPSSSTTTTLILSPNPIPKSSSTPLEFISNIVKSTIERAHHIKHPKKQNSSSSPSSSASVFHGTTNPPLFARSYGGYTISLSFGTPPQKIPLVFDTGSSLLWVPCTSRYTCSNCTFSSVNPSQIATFKPGLSSSTRVIGCRSPRCGWLFGPNVKARCGLGCGPGCSRGCPGYSLQYGLGATTGLAISETLNFPESSVHDFLLGCSLLSIRQPEGIAGFGRDPTSLPNQLKLGRFSYCLLPHKFDDAPSSSKMVLAGAGEKIPIVYKGSKDMIRYTPFVKNPTISPYNEYYYINLRKITIGKKLINLSCKYFLPDHNGDGGTIIDSGSTLTYMEQLLFEPLVKELAAQITHYKRAHGAEAQSGFGLCYEVKDAHNVSFPKLVFHFKGGAKMLMPTANYFALMTDLGVWCLTIISSTSPAGPSAPSGPVVIIGNYLQQNFYMEYDLDNQRLGIKKQKCHG